MAKVFLLKRCEDVEGQKLSSIEQTHTAALSENNRRSLETE
jgi:hypothetical protein